MRKVKEHKKKIPNSYNRLFPILLVIATLFMGIGYASIGSISLSVSGSAVALGNDDIFITEAVYKGNSGADIENSTIINCYQTMFNSKVVLSSSDDSSYITYTITINNNTDYDHIFTGVTYDSKFYSNENIVYELSGLNVNDMVRSKDSVTFDITFKYDSDVTPSSSINKLESYLNFKFVKYILTSEPGSFEYTGGIVEFVSTEKAKYFLQVWGAKGGNASGEKNGTYKGGLGGYSEGYVNLDVGDKLFLFIGGAGKDIHQDDYLLEDGTYEIQGVVAGGYNGGGDSYSTTKAYVESPGGGATHIATTNRGELFNYVDYKSEVLIVAGGGGGANYENASWNCSYGGAGGGLTSPDVGHGGNGVAYGASTPDETPGTGGSFGQGANGSSLVNNILPGGGGGYYGGGFVTRTDGTANSNKGSSGGSGYIGGVYDAESIAGNLSIPTYDGTSTMTGNEGNGYAKITFIEIITE